MKFYWIKTHIIIKKIFKNYIWDLFNNDKIVYLTFDDGPTPKVTHWVLSQLKNHNAKATFFCIGNNVKNNPEIYNELLNEGHVVGNHTFNHENGWETNTETYVESVLLTEKFIDNKHKLFRPPFGKLKIAQSRKLRELGYKIIMWDVLSADFDLYVSPEKCLENALKNVQSGSIIIFHDSQKAFKNLEYALPKTLEYLSKNNFKCEAIKL